MTARLVLGYPSRRSEALEMLDGVLQKATAVDGVTGEKGLAAYSADVIQGLAGFLALWNRVEPGFLGMILGRYPDLVKTCRFHIDTWCLGKHYPLVGDAGSFQLGAPRIIDYYLGVLLERLEAVPPTARLAVLNPSMFSFLWDLYLLTEDEAFVQALYRGNGDSLDGLPHDLIASDPEALRQGVQQVIAGAGKCTLWHTGQRFQAVRAAGQPVEGGPRRFERTVVRCASSATTRSLPPAGGWNGSSMTGMVGIPRRRPSACAIPGWRAMRRWRVSGACRSPVRESRLRRRAPWRWRSAMRRAGATC